MFNEAEYEHLKNSILALGPVLPGTIRKVFLRCGKKNCRCQSNDKKQWHGPYSFWDRKDGNKLSSRSISADQVKIIQGWINKRRELERIVRQMLSHGVTMAEGLKSSQKSAKSLNKSKSKKLMLWLVLMAGSVAYTAIFGLSSIAQAADIQAQLDSNDGSSGFSVQNKNGSQVSRIDSNGDLTAQGNVGIGTSGTGGVLLYVSPQGVAPEYAVGPGDAYIQNNLEVDGTTYLNDVYINGLEVNGLTLGPGPLSMGSLTVSGETYLATSAGNVGIGTVSPGSKFTVNGGAAIGTGLNYLSALAPPNGLLVQGNVGIGSLAPGESLDVNGTVRTVNLTISGQMPVSGYVLTASDSSGDTTWSSPGTVSGWTNSGSNVFETAGGNVGIGTTLLTSSALTVMNGNVGIGTWVPIAPLTVGLNAFTVSSSGAVTSSSITAAGAYTQIGNGINAFNGNVGIGSLTPGESLDVNGTVRTINFTMSGGMPISGYVLTASDSSGDTTWSSPGGVSGWTISGNNVFETYTGNVGIGTTLLTSSALTVMNGNVGIGTWVPIAPLTVGLNAFTVSSSGAITSSSITASGAYTQIGNDINAFNGNVGIGSLTPGESLDVNGTVRTVNLTMSGQMPVAGYVLTASDSSGDTTWSSPGGVSGWTISGNNVYETYSGNVGIGTTLLTSSALTVMNGNVGIGTWVPAEPLTVGANAFTVNSGGQITATTGITTSGAYTQSGNGINAFSGNVGIGSLTPGQALDVQGTVRTVNFAMSGEEPISGYVLTASDSSGDTTWSSPGGVSGWTISGNNVYETYSGNVGIGTTLLTSSALTVMNGNVGIGTWVPAAPLTVGLNAFTVNSGGQITATTGITTSGAYTQSGNGINAFSGNVGIGSLTPGQALDVNGTVRTVNFTMSGETPVAGFVLTAADSSGDTTWSSPGGVSGWTVSGNNVYETGTGNVGIGTTLLTSSALTVMNGNVGIGTWVPAAPLTVGLNAFTVNSGGQITATTGITTSGAYTQSGNGINAFTGYVGVGTTAPQTLLSVVGGNAGIGTWTAGNSLSVIGGVGIGSPIYANTAAPTNGMIVSGNVGIGSLIPGQALDVNGTVRTVNFTMSGETPVAGFVLTAADSSGDTTWSSPGGVSGWTVSGNNVYETGTGNVGIGTTLLTSSALTVMNGNVGIGTWVPAAPLTVGLNAFTVNSGGQITATTGITTSGAYTQSGNGINAFSGNVGIGSLTPGQALDVQGTVRTVNFAMSGEAPVAGFVLTASDSSGDSTWSSIAAISGWTTSGTNVYETGGGNVGIGTTLLTNASLTVMNGNVGIGTWIPAAPLTIGNNAFTVSSSGQITATTGITTSGAYTQSGNGINAFTGYIGVGTTAPQTLLSVVGGNVGVGTWTAGNSLSVIGGVGIGSPTYANSAAPANGIIVSGNVGIGSLTPGQALDVNGTVRTVNFTMSGQAPVSGFVLTASDSSGDTTWSSPGEVSGWTVSGNNVYETGSGNVGIGTTLLTSSALTVMNGNVGIGTWVPAAPLTVGLNAFTVSTGGQITATTGITTSGAYTQSGTGINAFSGNVGIGSLTPGQKLDVQGTLRTVNFTMSGQIPVAGFVLTASDSSGDTTWSSPGELSGWTVSGNNVYETGTGNVGIGTTLLTTSALTVMNGNVGIGTWVPAAPLTVGLNAFTVSTGGQITATTGITTSGAYTQSGTGINAFSGNVGIGSLTPGQKLDVQGTLRTVNFTMSGQAPVSGFVLTASDSSGDTTWSSPGELSGWTVSGNNVYETGTGNVGIGTTMLTSSALTVMNGNVGIGTWVPAAPLTVGLNAFTVNSGGQITATTGITTSGAYTQSGTGINAFSGNVGIGSLTPGQKLDVQGTLRTVNFTMSGQAPVSGFVLTASDSSGDTTWSSPGEVSGWTVSGNNVYETNSGNVGIGTTLLTSSALTVMNGNVGIGTWVPAAPLTVGSNAFTVNSSGQITATTGITTSGAYTQSGTGINAFSGNVGIGSLTPGQKLDVQGTLRTVNFTMSGQAPVSGFVLTASDSSGDTTWSSPGEVSGWTVSGNNVYETNSGNVGIGTTLLTSSALTVMNGNVGIGTWVPAAPLTVGLNAFTVSTGGQITATTGITTSGAYTQSGNGINAFSGNLGIGSLIPGQKLDVQGTLRTVNFTMSGQAPVSGFVLTASDSSGDTTWSSPGEVSGWTVSGNNVYETNSGNVGIGTTLLTSSALTVMNGNVGIGTWVPAAPLTIGNNAFTVNIGGQITATTGITTSGAYTQSGNGINAFSGNVGIGSLTPGQKLDVQGTLRTVNFTMSGEAPVSGFVLTASDSSGDTTWSSPAGLSGWTVSGNNVYETNSGNVGIGTTLLTSSALTVMNGNVGIGTWVPAAPLTIGNNAFTVNIGGQITATTGITTSGAYTQSGTGINAFSGNVGIGSLTPGEKLDVQGTIRTVNFIVSGEAPSPGYILSSIDSSGDTAWSSIAAISGWTPIGNNIYETGGGNVGIGTTLLTTAALTVMNGNVGIGTWVPAAPLTVGSNAFTVNSSGQITATTGITTSGAYTQSGTGINAFSGNVGIGSLTPGQKLDVQGTLRTVNFTMSGQAPVSGFVLTASDSSGDTTWSSPGEVSGWTVSGNNVYETNSGNVGIGTTLLTSSALTVMNGNVGIGTWVPAAPLTVGLNAFTVSTGGQITATTGITTSGAYTQSGNGINAFSGNLGIGSLIPGQKLDVQGTLRTVNFTMSGQAPVSGFVLTASDSSGDTTWSSPGEVSGWTVSGNNVYETNSGNVGIGTTLLTSSALTVMNGNVGIGTWVPAAPLTIGNNAFTVNIGGQITATTGITTSGAYTQSGNGINAFSGNVGIGSLTPGQKLDVQGTLRTVNFTMSGEAPVSGFVLTASDSSGDTTWSSPAGLSGWTVSGNNVYETNSGNVGIGTTLLTSSALTVMNGNVGIGTWVPAAPLTIGNNAFTVNIGGQITATTGITTSGAYTQSGNGINAFTGFVGVGTTAPQTLLSVVGGNVGVGTWTAGNRLSVIGGVGIGSAIYANTAAPSNGLIVQGNVGIGSLTPGQALDVQGTVRTVNFTMSGQAPISGYVLTASDSSGDTTWSSPGGVSGWTISGNNVYETYSGNVGIGTTFLSSAALTVMNGNVGIGTWTTVNSLDINNNAAIGAAYAGIKTAPPNGLIVQGNVGIGTTITANGKVIVMGGNVGIGTTIPPTMLAVGAGVPFLDTIMLPTAYFNGDVEVSGNVYATTVIGAQDLAGDLDLGGYFLKSNFGPHSNGTVNIHGGTGPDTPDLVVAPNSYVGIGTTTPLSRLTVNGGVGIGTEVSSNFIMTAAPAGGLIVQNNVGIGSTNPGQALDVNGITRTVNFTMSGQTPVSGFVLTASDSSGDTTWSSPGGVSGWTVSGNNVYETGTGNVGIGTTLLTTSALTVMNGNVGIGTWVPAAPLTVGLNAFTVNSGGQITATTGITTSGAYTQSGTGINAFSGNVGIGSLTPGQKLDVQGTIRTVNFTMSGQAPVSGFVLTASDSSGDTTWSSPGEVSGWTVSGNNVYETNSGNVGIGTTLLTSSALTVMNGNVGIGTWVPAAPLTVGLNAFTVNSGGQITATTGITTSGAYTQSGTGINAFSGNVGIGSLTPGEKLDVQGTLRTVNFAMSGQAPVSGFVLTASDSSGDSTWSNISAIGGWTVSGNNVYETAGGNVGIGTTLVTSSALTVMNGNVGIGTWVPAAPLTVGLNAFTVNSGGQITATTGITTSGAYTQSGTGINAFSGNVGIGSLTPGQKLDVQGTIRTVNFTMSGQAPVSGFVLTASDSSGDTTWSSPGEVSGWTVSGNNVYETNSGNVGIGTTLLTSSALTVMNGNVGIGTWVPAAPLTVGLNAFTVNSGGQITATTGITTSGAYTQSGTGINAFSGNVGIGSLTPGEKLDVQGTLRTVNFTMSGEAPVSGFVLTASDSSGDTTWSSPGEVSGWTVSGNNVYETNSGNVGIGTTLLTSSALTVMNGNVGIGTWVPAAPLTVGLNAFTVSTGGQITATTGITTSGAYTQSGNGVNAFSGNVGIGSLTPGQKLDVQGTTRTVNFTMSGQSPTSGFVLTASDSSGDSTWSSIGAISGWTTSGNNVYETGGGNVGIGTTLLTNAALTVMNGNVGIGTWVPAAPLTVGLNAFTVNSGGQITATTGITTSGAYTQSGTGINAFSGNVGIGSLTPGQKLDVQGTIRTVNFTMSGQAPISGYVLTAADSSGDTTWSSPGGVSGWTVSGSNVYETGSGNVGIGTTLLTSSALTVMNGNVGIGTWVPAAPLTVGLNAFTVNSGGQITATTGITTSGAYTQSGTGVNAFSGNVGIGSLTPGQKLDVQGTIRTVNFTMSGQAPVSGFVLTASDSSGDSTWSNISAIGGWTVSGNNVYETAGGNVGIGTTLLTTAALTVMNGNVGIGTWVPIAPFQVNGSSQNVYIAQSGNIGIGTWVPAVALSVLGGVDINKSNLDINFNNDVLTFGASTGTDAFGFTPIIFGNNNIQTSAGFPFFLINPDNSTLGNLIEIRNGATPEFDVTAAGYVGIGSATPYNALSVVGGAAIGSAAYAGIAGPSNGLIVAGNVGIGSTNPGQALDVQGTVRTVNFTMSGQAPISGYVLTASDSAGDTTWSSPGGVSGWTISGNNVYETYGGNVGIGTNLLTTAALTVMNGNVGIGTWVPGGSLIVQGGNVGIGTNSPSALFDVNGNSILGTTGSSTDSIASIGTGSLAGGYAQHIVSNSGNITASNFGSLAFGLATGNLSGSGNIISNNTGSIALGNVVQGTLEASGLGSVAMGDAQIGTLQASGSGSIAMGIAVGGGNTLQATGQGSVAMGQNVQAIADRAFALGSSVVNPNMNSLMIGFNATPTLTVTGSGVGIGTSSPFGGGLIVLPANTGNVGIGSLTPGQALDVQGTIRTVNFTMSGQTPVSGFVLTASDSSGDTTWSSPGGVSGWTVSGNNVYETGNGNVGIGTTILTNAALSVMNGNVGIGTWVPAAEFQVNNVASSPFAITSAGNVGIGTNTPQAGLVVTNGNVGIGTWTAAGGNLIINGGGNVGIGSAWPGFRLDVNGTIRMTGFNLSTTPTSGYVLTADNNGNGTWMPVTGSGTVTSSPQFQVAYYPSTGTTVQGGSSFQYNGTNVGIGTTLSVNRLDIQGGVGIGTAYAGYVSAPPNGMIVQGNVGIGSSAPGQKLDVQGTLRTVNFTMSGQSPIAGFVMTASDSSGDTTWSSPGGVSGWTTSGNNVYETGGGNVGIGTNLINTAALTVMNGNVGIGTWIPNSTLSLNGSMAVTVVNTAGPYTATSNDNVILVTAGGPVTITLPLATAVPGREYVIKKTDSQPTNIITITDGANQIDGQLTLSITVQYQSYTVVSDGHNWDII